MNLAAFSPRKLNLFSHSPPRTPARKRNLFPSNSPQTSDLGLISELGSDDSDTYSPPLLSPSLSITPDKNAVSPMQEKLDNILRVANHLNFNKSPKKSPRKMLGKENFDVAKSVKKSPKKSQKKYYLDKENFDGNFITILPESPENDTNNFSIKASVNCSTPDKKTEAAVQNLRRSPRSSSKIEAMIKPNSFYGSLAPLLATNQTNRIQGMKCVFRPPQQSKAKVKLQFDDKPRKRERSRSADVMRAAKKRKAVFTGVHHAIPKPMKYSPPQPVNNKQSIREKARKVTDLSRTPYGMNKRKKKEEGWEYTLRFTKPMRYEEGLDGKRKFFKTILRDSPSTSPGSFIARSPSPVIPKKRKLLDTRKSYLDENTPPKLKINTSDISELINDQEADVFQEKPEMDDILLRLEEDDDEDKKKEKEKQMLMSLLEDSPGKVALMDTLSDCTASLDINDSQSTGCSRFELDDDKKTGVTPSRMFPLFNRSASNTPSSGSVRKRKWKGVGDNQLQIDAGQRVFGAVQCPECGMVYQVGEAEDEIQHNSFHNNLSTLRHLMWKKENVVGCFGMDYALVVTGDDPKSWQQKALDVIALVDKSLGITSDSLNVMHNQKVFLYISDKRIVGCMVANPVSRAYKMINSESDVDICSEESYPVRCGISRMWTLFSHRRRGIASKLLDTVRRNFMYGSILSRADVAFSIPTPDGKQFVAKYMESPNFYVYTGY